MNGAPAGYLPRMSEHTNARSDDAGGPHHPGGADAVESPDDTFRAPEDKEGSGKGPDPTFVPPSE